MIQEDKQLLLKDLCARLPYHVMVEYRGANVDLTQHARSVKIENCKPYLRPMSSMTEEEWQEYDDFCDSYRGEELHLLIDWLNAHHFDYRTDPSTGKTMIEAGLALEAPEGMYKIE